MCDKQQPGIICGGSGVCKKKKEGVRGGNENARESNKGEKEREAGRTVLLVCKAAGHLK